MLDDIYSLPVINNPKMFMKMIVEATERLPGDYVLKKYKATNIKGEANPHSTIWIISKRNALKEFDNDKVYYRDEFTAVAEKLLEEKCSLVCMTENGEGIIVAPKIFNYDGSRVKKYESLLAFDVVTHDEFSNIVFYLYNDELLEAMKLLVSILKNNPEILNISEKKQGK